MVDQSFTLYSLSSCDLFFCNTNKRTVVWEASGMIVLKFSVGSNRTFSVIVMPFRHSFSRGLLYPGARIM